MTNKTTTTEPTEATTEATFWQVTAVRSTVYKVQAATEDEAIDAVLDGEGEEIGGETERVTAEPLTASGRHLPAAREQP